MWHIALEGLPGSNVCYGFKVDGDGGWETGEMYVECAQHRLTRADSIATHLPPTEVLSAGQR